MGLPYSRVPSGSSLSATTAYTTCICIRSSTIQVKLPVWHFPRYESAMCETRLVRCPVTEDHGPDVRRERKSTSVLSDRVRTGTGTATSPADSLTVVRQTAHNPAAAAPAMAYMKRALCWPTTRYQPATKAARGVDGKSRPVSRCSEPPSCRHIAIKARPAVTSQSRPVLPSHRKRESAGVSQLARVTAGASQLARVTAGASGKAQRPSWPMSSACASACLASRSTPASSSSSAS